MASELSVAKFEHSCFYLAKDGRGILFDPVEYLAKLPELTGIEAVIITHQHGDHFQPAVLEKIRAANPDALVFTTEDNAQGIPGAKAVKPGDKFMVGGFSLEFAAITPRSCPGRCLAKTSAQLLMAFL